MFSKISDVKGGNQFFKFGVGKEKGGGDQNFSKILGGNQSLTHYDIFNLLSVPLYLFHLFKIGLP